MDLATLHCAPCSGTLAALNSVEAEHRLSEIPGWQLIDRNQKLQHLYKFKDYASTLHFVDGVAAVCEEQGHHPEITFGWGYATVTFWTHALKALSDNDFIMAAKVNALYHPL